MQLTNIFAAFSGKPPAAAPLATPIAATPATTAPAVVPAVATPTTPQPVEDAGFAATLLGKVGASQNRFLANQQLLGAVSSAIGARMSHIASTALQLLRGELPADAA